MDKIKFNTEQLVIEALTLMRYTGAERILVIEGSRSIGWVTFSELTNFIYDYEDAGNVRVHKLHFDLGTAMISIRDIRSRDSKRPDILKPLLTIALVLLSVALLFSKPLTRFIREVMKKLEPVEVVVPKKAVRKVVVEKAEEVAEPGDVAEPEELYFRNKSLEDIMDVLAGWYGVEVVYEDDSPRKMRFGGSFRRTDKLEGVLQMLEGTKELRFKVEGNKVIVWRGR